MDSGRKGPSLRVLQPSRQREGMAALEMERVVLHFGGRLRELVVDQIWETSGGNRNEFEVPGLSIGLDREPLTGTDKIGAVKGGV